MGKKDNFNRAMYEMFGVGKEPDEDLLDELAPTADGGTSGMGGGVPTGGGSSGGGGGQPPFEGPARLEVEMPTTVIAPGTVIEGSIRSKGHMDMAGELKGDLRADGSVTLRGTVTGNVHGQRVDMVSCTVVGDVRADGAVTVDAGSRLKGNVLATDLQSDGAIQGDLDIKKTVSLRSGAVVDGNITAQSLSMEPNVALRGTVTVPRKQQKGTEGEKAPHAQEGPQMA